MRVVERLHAARDLDAVMAIEDASFTNPWSREMLLRELQHSEVARAWVLRDDRGAVTAFCWCWLVLDELHIHTLAVDPVHRREGRGRMLLDGVLRDAVAQGARSATLEVRESNEPARRLYEQAGFTLTGRRPGYYEKPPEDALILSRELRSWPLDA
jgi:ribosomal-protein-alanine N-acetyltransferase